MRKTVLLALGIILSCGVYFFGLYIARLGKCEVNYSNSRSNKKMAEPKYRPINPPVDVMVNPLLKPLREGDLCVTE